VPAVANYTPHLLVAFGGVWDDQPGEVWECTLRGLVQSGDDPAAFDSDAYLASVAPSLSTWFSGGVALMAGHAQLKWLKCNAINATGHYTHPTTSVFDYSGTILGSGGSLVTPGFCSLAYTWETGIARGRAHRGRMYPPNSWPLATPFTVSAANANSNGAAGAALLHALDNGASGIATQEINFGIFSALDASHHNIVACTSDNIFDVQRRRKNRVPSVRGTETLYVHP
jgi:hypothetical protein